MVVVVAVVVGVLLVAAGEVGPAGKHVDQLVMLLPEPAMPLANYNLVAHVGPLEARVL